MIKKMTVIFVYCIVLPICSFAAPVVAPLSDNSFSDGDSVVITGENFGSNSLKREWLGGSLGNIENGTGIFTKTKWSVDPQSTSRQAPVYSTTRSHSGSKSILSELPVQTQYTSGFGYDNGATFDSIYATYWVYYEHVDSSGQWKMWRIRPNSSYGDTNGEIMTSQWYNVDGSNMQNYVILFCDPANYNQCFPDGVSDFWGQNDDTITPNQWIRVEIYAQGSSDGGISDGKLYYAITRNGKTTHVMRDYSEITTRLSDGTPKWKNFVFENYWGNISSGTGTKEKIYIDDIYLQFNNRARVEIGNAETFADCTHREIQIPTKWNPRIRDVESIKFTINRGSFTNGPAYVFVVDEAGNPSNGIPITIK